MLARAVQFTAPRQVAVVPVPVPDEPADGQLLVRTAYSGISAGSELLAYRGELDRTLPRDERLGGLAGGTFDYPFGYGYACTGQVERGAAPGTPVFAFHPHQERFVVGVADAVELPAQADLRTATWLPLVETALQVSLDAGPRLGEPVALLGLGAVGLLTGLLLARAGARVLAGEPDPARRATATRLGLRAVDPAGLPALVAAETAGRGVGVLVELSGAPAALAAGLPLLAHEGTALVGSWYGTKPVSLPLGAEFHRRRLTIRSSQVSTVPAALAARWDVPRRRAVARDLLGELPIGDLPTVEYPLERAPAAYAALDVGTAGALHVTLRYDRPGGDG